MNIYSTEGLIIDGSGQSSTGFRLLTKNGGAYSTTSSVTVLTFTVSGSAPTNHKIGFYRVASGGPLNSAQSGINGGAWCFYLNSSGYYVASSANSSFSGGNTWSSGADNYNVATLRTIKSYFQPTSTSYLPVNMSMFFYACSSDWSYVTIS